MAQCNKQQTQTSQMSFTQVDPNQQVDGTIVLIKTQVGRPTPHIWKPPLWSWILGMCTLSVVISYADRTNISTAIIPMAKHFQWGGSEKGAILSVFFVGYAITQIVGGWVSDKVGGKGVLAFGIAIWSVCTILTPEAARAGWPVLIASRIALGLGEGVAFPAIHSIISCNVPVPLQSSAVSIVTAASYAGTVFAFAVSPSIIGKWGWQWVFYGFGALALVWLPFWIPTPVASQTMKYKNGERPLCSGGVCGLLESMDAETQGRELSPDDLTQPLVNSRHNTSLLSDLKKVLPLISTRPVLAICIAQYTQSWGMYVLINWLPTFFNDRYGIDVNNLGFYTLGPYIVQSLIGLASGPMADFLLASGWHTVTVRRIFQSVGMVGPAVCLLLASVPKVAASVGDVAAIITAGLGLSAFSLSGVSVSHLDVAPRHAGAVFGVGNTAATVAGFVGVWVVGWILGETHSWPLVFAITTAHYIIGVVIWNAWVGGEPLVEDLS